MKEDHFKIFNTIYDNNLWQLNKDSRYSLSGIGSDLDFNIEYIPFLKNFILSNRIKSIIDLGCGDFHIGEYIYNDINNINYYGYDIYENIIKINKDKFNPNKYSFEFIDFLKYKDDIISGDLCIIKDVFQHWSNKSIISMMNYLISSKKYKYILVCDDGQQKNDELIDYSLNFEYYRPLSANFYPLKKYNLQIIFKYGYRSYKPNGSIDTFKEVSYLQFI
jgi:SAM-dependent methyltransferase